MARTSQLTQIGKHKIELSNLEKVLFPDEHIIKAEIIEYYLTIAPTILQHIKNRPLSLVRFPDGISGERFFQKNKPEWTPDWVASVVLGDGEKAIDYILATEEATLVWLANLACLELHQMQSHKPTLEKPDYFVFDLDPPEGEAFRHVVETAFALKEQIERYGYHTFVKTTGGKGVHILVPVEAQWDYHTVFAAAQSIAKPFVEKHARTTTLHIKKDARKGKILVDIYRNRFGQTIVAPYSIRGRAGAPVSAPLSWDDLRQTDDPRELNIASVKDKVLAQGDAWEGFAAYAVPLHTQSSQPKAAKAVEPARTYKTPEQLQAYEKKRRFHKTPEPGPEYDGGQGNGFVIHRHHASRLHYDLRIEKDGTLKSWAVPRGLPPRPGIKRLAVAVEDHPMKYLSFEGEIPRGEYGGGMMWIYALGKYEITKQKKDGFYFRLHSRELNGEYRIYHTKDKDWLLERLDTPQVDWLTCEIEPMLAQSVKTPPRGDAYIYEVKWDGIRALITLNEGQLIVRSRNQRDITAQFPELNIPEQAFRAASAVFDGEIVVLEADGRPSFKRVINRMQQRSQGAIERAVQKDPAICYLFDCLYLDGRPLLNDPLWRRREWLVDAVKKETSYRVSDFVEEGEQLFEAAKQMGIEGIVAKDRNSRYHPGKRSSNWFKIKSRNTADCVIIGYTEGKGDRSECFGALQIAEIQDNKLVYRGKVGTGFDAKLLKAIFSRLQRLKKVERPAEEKPLDDAATTWVEPKLFCELQYASLTPNGTFREPVFVRLRPDLQRENATTKR